MKRQKVVSVSPWYNAAQFRKVYQYLYSDELIKKKWAFDTISVWETRCHPSLPAAVEASYVLTSAVIQDTLWSKGVSPAHHTDIQAVYGSAITRFVNLVVEVHKDPVINRPLVDIAKGLGIPPLIVSVRNDWCHLARPSLPRLREAAEAALEYLKVSYWEVEEKRMRNQIKEPVDEKYIKSVINEYMINMFNVQRLERQDSVQVEDIEDFRAKNKSVLKKLDFIIRKNKQYFVKILVSDGIFIPLEEDFKYLMSKEDLKNFQSDSVAMDGDQQSDSELMNIAACVVPRLPVEHEKLWGPLISVLHKYDAVPLLIQSLLMTQGDKTEPGQKLILAWIVKILRIHSSIKGVEKSSYLKSIFKRKAMIVSWKRLFFTAVLNPCKYTAIILPLIFYHLDLKKETMLRVINLMSIYLGFVKSSNFQLRQKCRMFTENDLKKVMEQQKGEKAKSLGNHTSSIWSSCLDKQHKFWPIGCILNAVEDENDIQPIEEDLLENFLEYAEFSERFLPSNKNDDEKQTEIEMDTSGPDAVLPSPEEIDKLMMERKSLLYC